MRNETSTSPLDRPDMQVVHAEDEHRAAEAAFNRRASGLIWLGIFVALPAMALISFCLGRYHLLPGDLLLTVYRHFFDTAAIVPKADVAVFSIRFPRIVVVSLVGAALAVAGASYQGMFKNPLVSPDLLGASAGASLGACIALLFNMPNTMVQLLAFIGGMAAVGMAVWLNRLVRYDPTLGLVLGGILVSTVFQSGTSLIKLVADANDKLPAITFWLMGSFASVDQRDMRHAVIPILAGIAVLLFQSWRLNVLSFGDEEASSLGINTRRTRLVVIFAATLVTSTSVAVAGIVGWVGLVIPHLARALVGPNYRVLLPTSILIGAAYLLLIDNIARLAATVEIPIGILTAVFGVPFFVVIFRRQLGGR